MERCRGRPGHHFDVLSCCGGDRNVLDGRRRFFPRLSSVHVAEEMTSVDVNTHAGNAWLELRILEMRIPSDA